MSAFTTASRAGDCRRVAGPSEVFSTAMLPAVLNCGCVPSSVLSVAICRDRARLNFRPAGTKVMGLEQTADEAYYRRRTPPPAAC